MNHPKLLPSQELVLHQVSMDSFSPATVSVLKFPTSPLLRRSPYTPIAAVPQGGTPVASPVATGTTTVAAPSIVRPQIRCRDEWAVSLRDVDTFDMPTSFLHTSSFDRKEKVAVRYIADKYDRTWLAKRPVLLLRGADGAVNMVRGKTGSLSSHTPIASQLSMSILEDIFTTLELAAYHHPEVPLERLIPYAGPLLHDSNLPDEIIEQVHAYWLLRRAAMGGLVPTIASVRIQLREDNELTICDASILRDCPLPFKLRDWYVPVIQRRIPRLLPTSSRRKRLRGDEVRDESQAIDEELETCRRLLQTSKQLSYAVLRREELRMAHTCLTLYELITLRRLGDREGLPSNLLLDTALTNPEELSELLGTIACCPPPYNSTVEEEEAGDRVTEC